MSEEKLLKHLREWGIDAPTLVEAIESEPEQALKRLRDEAYHATKLFTPEVVRIIIGRMDRAPDLVFLMLHQIALKLKERRSKALKTYLELMDRYPAEGVNQAYFICVNDSEIASPALLERLCAHFGRDPVHVFIAFNHIMRKRPELIHEGVVKAALDNIAGATYQAFYFLRDLIASRPEFTPLCTLALFECVLHERTGWRKCEELQSILLVARNSHIKTSLEKRLRAPIREGNKRARTLMAMLFRQKMRVRQQVLLEALECAAGYPALWNFFVELLDNTDEGVVSSAAAENFLEHAYRLSLIVPHRFEAILVKKLEPSESDATFGSFLDEDAELVARLRRTKGLAERLGTSLRISALEAFDGRVASAERELEAIGKLLPEAGKRRAGMEKRARSLRERLRLWRCGETTPRERRELTKKVRDGFKAGFIGMALEAIEAATGDAYKAAAKRILGRDVDLSRVDTGILPALIHIEKLQRGRNREYLIRLIEDRIEGRPHDWLWTEKPVVRWTESVKAGGPELRLDRWRAPFVRRYSYHPKNAAKEKERRIRDDLKQTRRLFEKMKVKGVQGASCEKLVQKLQELRTNPPEDAEPDREVLDEIEINLKRIRIMTETPDSDFEGRIEFEVEADPFQYLFMGEYGFASCLSIRGSHFWSAVSNAIDVDKAVIWAREPSGNIVGRRLIALTPGGIVSYRTYANRHGLGLDAMFRRFIGEYAKHCGTRVAHRIRVGPLLSDAWYDDGAL